MILPRATACITGHSVRIVDGVWKTCGGVVIYWVSFAQESGCRYRLDIAALWVAVEHVRARIGVSTGFCCVRSTALRLMRAGSERPPRGRAGSAETERRANGVAARRCRVRGKVGGWTGSFGIDRLGRCSFMCTVRNVGNHAPGSRARPDGQTDVGFLGRARSEVGRYGRHRCANQRSFRWREPFGARAQPRWPLRRAPGEGKMAAFRYPGSRRPGIRDDGRAETGVLRNHGDQSGGFVERLPT